MSISGWWSGARNVSPNHSPSQSSREKASWLSCSTFARRWKLNLTWTLNYDLRGWVATERNNKLTSVFNPLLNYFLLNAKWFWHTVSAGTQLTVVLSDWQNKYLALSFISLPVKTFSYLCTLHPTNVIPPLWLLRVPDIRLQRTRLHNLFDILPEEEIISFHLFLLINQS